MTKRSGNLLNNNGKKIKTNENLNDLWGDDLDAKDVDDCFALATQAWKQDNLCCTQRNNVSILPPYNVFKLSSKRFTSTQSDPNLHSPSTSKAPFANGVDKRLSNWKELCSTEESSFKRTRSFESPEPSYSELKFKNIHEQYVAKEGEVSILRTQLKDIKASKENELNKKQKEWADKLAATTKQLSATRSELEFKNLEIANLKQKVVEVAKLNNLDITLNSTQTPFLRHKQLPEKCTTSSDFDIGTIINCKKIQVQPMRVTQIPLQHKIPATIFDFPNEEKYLIDIKSNQMCRNTIPFLQNQMSQDLQQQLVRLQPKHTVLDNNKQLEFDYVHCEISKLMKYNTQEIESEENNALINKIVCVSEQVIFNLYQFLQELEQNSQLENSQEMAVMYLEQKYQDVRLDQSLFDTNKWCEDEMGISAKQSIVCISEILPYNSYLRDYLLYNKPLIFKGGEEFLKYLPLIVRPKLEKDYFNNFGYLHLISSVVILIGKLKISDKFPGFISAITVLLNKMCLNISSNELHSQIVKITQEIVFCRPNSQILYHFTEFLKNASLQNMFVRKLCKMPKTNTWKLNQKETVLYYNQETCILQVLCVLLESSILQIQNSKILDVYLNIIRFVSNSVKCNPQWLFYQEYKHCDCLSKIVKLYVDVMYKTVERLHKNPDAFTNRLLTLSKVLKSGLRTMHVLFYKVDDLIVKYVITYSQFKDIVKSLWSLKNHLELTESEFNLLNNLIATEEIPTVVHSTFSSISLWN